MRWGWWSMRRGAPLVGVLAGVLALGSPPAAARPGAALASGEVAPLAVAAVSLPDDLASGVLPATTASAPEPQLRTVRFGSTQALSDAGVFIARDRGYFREQGIDVDYVAFQSGPDTMIPMASGDLEIGSG